MPSRTDGIRPCESGQCLTCPLTAGHLLPAHQPMLTPRAARAALTRRTRLLLQTRLPVQAHKRKKTRSRWATRGLRPTSVRARSQRGLPALTRPRMLLPCATSLTRSAASATLLSKLSKATARLPAHPWHRRCASTKTRPRPRLTTSRVPLRARRTLSAVWPN